MLYNVSIKYIDTILNYTDIININIAARSIQVLKEKAYNIYIACKGEDYDYIGDGKAVLVSAERSTAMDNTSKIEWRIPVSDYDVLYLNKTVAEMADELINGDDFTSPIRAAYSDQFKMMGIGDYNAGRARIIKNLSRRGIDPYGY